VAGRDDCWIVRAMDGQTLCFLLRASPSILLFPTTTYQRLGIDGGGLCAMPATASATPFTASLHAFLRPPRGPATYHLDTCLSASGGRRAQRNCALLPMLPAVGRADARSATRPTTTPNYQALTCCSWCSAWHACCDFLGWDLLGSAQGGGAAREALL